MPFKTKQKISSHICVFTDHANIPVVPKVTANEKLKRSTDLMNYVSTEHLKGLNLRNVK